MASLQARLEATFGSLASSQQPAWTPTEQQVFRAGAVQDRNSSDEEWEEKTRREAVPGLAQALVEEDEPDEEGFRPSTAFCRQLDAEEEYNEVDEVAMGNISRHAGEGLPPRDTQVLDDNIYEERMRQRAVGAAAGDDAEQPSGMEVEEAALPGTAAAAPAASPEKKRRVRFQEGVAEPPSTARPPSQPWGDGSGSRVPDYVRHPDKYTCYTLDEPLVVGGGVAQLADGQQNQRQQVPAAADVEAQPQEAERWVGPPGSIQFVSRQRRAGEAAGAAPAGHAAVAGGPPTSKRAGPQVPAAICVELEEAEAAEAGADAEMRAAGADPAPGAAAGRAKRQYRTSRSAGEDAE